MKGIIKKYIGKTIESFSFERSKITFLFTDKENLELFAQGDCCSESWFEQISGEEACASGAIFSDLELITMEDVTHGDYQTEVFYGFKIKTDKGIADVDMRNMSNGFYGGFISVNIDEQYTSDKIYPDWS